MTGIRVLGVSGSLRSASSNTLLLHAARSLAPAGIAVELFEGIGALPHFNPDHDREPYPGPVRDWRSRVAGADALLISSPEYAHGVPGVLKNALDWLVSGVEIPYKPVALLNASPRSTHAQSQLVEILTTMSTAVVCGAAFLAPVPKEARDVAHIVAIPPLAAVVREALDALAVAVADARAHPRTDPA